MFSTIGVTSKNAPSRHIENTSRLLIELLQSRNYTVFLDQCMEGLIVDKQLTVKNCVKSDLGKLCDLIIVVGGDGSFLSAAREIVNQNIPIVGVNLGKLGFLTDISPDQLEQQLDAIFSGNYDLKDRFLLETEVVRSGEIISYSDALNDVVLHPGQSTKMVEFELYINNQFVYRQQADGLIVATPTGSTAYALSAGGPIMHPTLDAIVLVPMYPHILTNRPLVIDGKSSITVIVHSSNTLNSILSCDGQVEINLQPKDEIRITKKARLLKVLHPEKHDFYERCRSKLRWNLRENK